MKRYFILVLTIIVFFVFLLNSVLASWVTLSLDGRMTYDDNRSTQGTDAGPSYTDGINLSYSMPLLLQVPVKGTMGVNNTENALGKTRSFRISLGLSSTMFSFQGNRSEDYREDYVSGGNISFRNDYSASFTPKEKYLPQLRYSFNESDTDLGGANNSFDFRINQSIRPGSQISFDMGYSISRTIDIISEKENENQRLNFRVDSNPFSNIKLSLSKDYGLTDDMSTSYDPRTETVRTAYDISLNKMIHVDPFEDLTFSWRRSEDFSSSSGELRVTTNKNVGLSLKPFDKIDIKYDYALTEDESDLNVNTTNNSGQNFTITIPFKFSLDLKYNYSLRKNADVTGIGTNSEDNGFTVGYRSPMVKGSAFNLNFSIDTNSRQAITDTETREQETLNWGVDGRATIVKVFDVNFSHRDTVNKSNSLDDQQSIADSIGTGLKYSILQLVDGGIDFRYNTRSSNAQTLTSESNDRSINNRLTYRTGNFGVGLTNSYTENETDNSVTSKKNMAPNLDYSLGKGRVSFRYSISDRVDEDPITGELTSSRDVSYDMGYSYDIAPQAKFDIRYSARNHIDFERIENNNDGDKITTGLSFKF